MSVWTLKCVAACALMAIAMGAFIAASIAAGHFDIARFFLLVILCLIWAAIVLLFNRASDHPEPEDKDDVW